jgi:hypothetical protein
MIPTGNGRRHLLFAGLWRGEAAKTFRMNETATCRKPLYAKVNQTPVNRRQSIHYQSGTGFVPL